MLPSTNPKDDATGLSNLQEELLVLAEEYLGPRERAIETPRFHDGVPIVFIPDDGSEPYAKLSRNGELYWPTALYELAHETVHLLNPETGLTNWLEEGLAVEFSIFAQGEYGVSVQRPQTGSYYDALVMLRTFSHNPFYTAKLLRSKCGKLRKISETDLKEANPAAKGHLLKNLAKTCVP